MKFQWYDPQPHVRLRGEFGTRPRDIDSDTLVITAVFVNQQLRVSTGSVAYVSAIPADIDRGMLKANLIALAEARYAL